MKEAMTSMILFSYPFLPCLPLHASLFRPVCEEWFPHLPTHPFRQARLFLSARFSLGFRGSVWSAAFLLRSAFPSRPARERWFPPLQARLSPDSCPCCSPFYTYLVRKILATM